MKTRILMKTILTLLIFGIKTSLAMAQCRETHPTFALEALNISMLNPHSPIADIHFAANALVTGRASVWLSLPDEIAALSDRNPSDEGHFTTGTRLQKQWRVRLPQEGYFLLQIGLDFQPDSVQAEGKDFINYHSFPLYVTIQDGQIVEANSAADTRFIQAPAAVDKTMREIKSEATPQPYSAMVNAGSAGATSYTISMQISGRVSYFAAYSVQKGVPDVGVYLDWDYDNNPMTGYTPYYGGGARHVDYDLTDDNGYYYFSFSFPSDKPANQISPRIRVYANNANSAAFDWELGNGARIPIQPMLDISGATTSVFFNAVNIEPDNRQGGALRYLYRVRQFTINELGINLPQIKYFIRPGLGTYFCRNGNCNVSGGPDLDAPYIVFDEVPNSHLGYHEYGHYIEYAHEGGAMPDGNCPDPHSFLKESNHACAWVEGWAEFIVPAAHDYWYALEMPAQIEARSGFHQFLDAAQLYLPRSQDNTDLEGAVATFFYSLWDGVKQRAPGYSGDNDDISFSGAFLLNRFSSRYVPGYFGLRANTHIESYKLSLLDALPNHMDVSVNALYDALILGNGSARPATPTTLQVGGNQSTRTLTWNDTTCPGIVSFLDESNSTRAFDLVENNEQGFHIYRKAVSNSWTWDGTLSGYALVGTAGPNATSWTDNVYLTGRHSYVTVAYNGGDAIPQAEQTIMYSAPLSVSISGPGSLNINQSGTFTANVSGGSAPYSYQWYRMYTCAGSPDFAGEDSTGNHGNGQGNGNGGNGNGNGHHESDPGPTLATCGIWYTIGTNSAMLTTSSSGNFQLKAVVTDAAGAQVEDAHSVSINGAGGASFGGEIISAYDFKLETNYPNPFAASTTIAYALPQAGPVRIAVYNAAGQLVRTLTDGEEAAGRKSVTWDGATATGERAPNGVYLYRLESNGFSQTRRMALLK